MKFLKEFSFQCFVFLVLISLLFVGWDMSRPIVNSAAQINAEDVVECIVYPFTDPDNTSGENFKETARPDFGFLSNIVLPITIYILCAGGMIYLVIENLRLLKASSYQSKPGRVLWIIWLGILGASILLPILFGAQLVMKGFILAVIATVIFLLMLSIISRLSNPSKKYRK